MGGEMSPALKDRTKTDVHKTRKKAGQAEPLKSEGPMKRQLTRERQEEVNEQLLEGAQCDDLEMVKDALANGVDANAVDPLNNTALMYTGDIEIARLLVEHGADVNHRGDEATPLIYAAQYNKKDIVEFLLSKDADANARNISGQTPLHRCTRWASHLEIAKILIVNRADVNAKCGYNTTPLDHALHSKNEKMIELLKRHDARESSSF